MKFVKEIFFAAAAVLFISSLALQAQDTGGAKGRIKNAQDRGLSGVSVSVEQDGKVIRKGSTDKGGSFKIDGLKSGKYNFVFSKTGFATGTLNDVEVGGKQIRNLGNRLLEIDEGTLVFIKGTVFNEDGRAISDAKVEIEKISGSGPGNLKPDYTSESGEFTFRLAEGAAKFRITASAKGRSVSKEVEVDSAAIYRLALTLNLSAEKEN